MELDIKGYVSYQVVRGDKIIEIGDTTNLVVTKSREFLAKLASGTASYGHIEVMAIGSGNTAVTVDDTALATEVARLALPAAGTNNAGADANEVTTTSGVTKTTFRQVFTPGATTIREFGLFGGLSVAAPGSAGAGDLFNRALIGDVSLGASDSIIIESVLVWG